MELSRVAARRGSLLPDLWTAEFRGIAEQWEAPLVDLTDLGISHDQDGFVSSSQLKPLKPGAEAEPYLDSDQAVVYKLFFANSSGSLGKKIVFHFGEDGFEVSHSDACWFDTLEKSKFSTLAEGYRLRS